MLSWTNIIELHFDIMLVKKLQCFCFRRTPFENLKKYSREIEETWREKTVVVPDGYKEKKKKLKHFFLHSSPLSLSWKNPDTGRPWPVSATIQGWTRMEMEPCWASFPEPFGVQRYCIHQYIKVESIFVSCVFF